jgi:hypothetical protein
VSIRRCRVIVVNGAATRKGKGWESGDEVNQMKKRDLS